MARTRHRRAVHPRPQQYDRELTRPHATRPRRETTGKETGQQAGPCHEARDPTTPKPVACRGRRHLENCCSGTRFALVVGDGNSDGATDWSWSPTGSAQTPSPGALPGRRARRSPTPPRRKAAGCLISGSSRMPSTTITALSGAPPRLAQRLVSAPEPRPGTVVRARTVALNSADTSVLAADYERSPFSKAVGDGFLRDIPAGAYRAARRRHASCTHPDSSEACTYLDCPARTGEGENSARR